MVSDLDRKLIDAAIDGNITKVKALIEAGADVNVKDEDGMTVLMCAVMAGNTEIANLLRAAGAEKE